MPKHIAAIIFILLGVACQQKAKKSKETNLEVNPKKWELIRTSDNSQPYARHEAAFVAVGEKFYLLGGRGIKSVSIFDTKTKTWSEGAVPPIELHHFQPIVHQDKIYILGAMTGKWPEETPTTHIYIYDPIVDTWSVGDEIPEDRRRGSTGNVLVNDKIYMACGIKNGHIGDHKNWLDVYDLKTGEWQLLKEAPKARDHFQAVLANNELYMLAGRNSTSPDNPFGNTIAEVDVYNLETNTWRTLDQHLPTKRAGNMAVSFDNQILVVGGESDTQEFAHNDVEVLDLKTKQWSKFPSMLEGRHGTGIIIKEGVLYVASGCGKRGGEPELFTIEMFK